MPLTDTKVRNISLALETFQVVTTEWLNKIATKWLPSYKGKVQSLLEANVLPRIGKILISSLNRPHGDRCHAAYRGEGCG